MSLSFIRRLTMPLPELETYYCERRKERFAQGKRLKNIQLREAFYPLFAVVLKLDRLFRKQKVTVIGNRKKSKEQVIFACTHTWENDLENIYEVLGRGCWWFVGDPCVLYKDISGLLVYLNGSIFLETDDKEDRHIAFLHSVELLKGGGSLMIFPEGARNGSENLPVMPLFSGTAKMAIESNVKIVPIAIEQFEKRFVINFGNELFPKDFDDNTSLTQRLRDDLATLKWEIWEQEGIQSRKDIPADYSEQFIRQFAQRIYPYDTLESVERTRYHTKEEMEQRDAFAHLDRLIPCKENAFLFRKR
ncbi:MAG: lysophospholipid acyltransferase family protein [Acetatifactor sp.]